MIHALKRGLGGAVFGLLRLFCRTGEKVDLGQFAAQRILTVQGLRIGDTITTLPAIAALRRLWPQAEIIALAQPDAVEVLALSGLVDTMVPWLDDGGRLANGKKAVDRLQPIDLAVVFDCTLTSMLAADHARGKATIGYDSYNRGFGLTHAMPAPSYWNRPARHCPPGVPVRSQVDNWCRLLQGAGIPAQVQRPALHPRPSEMEWAEAFLGDVASRPVVALHPGTQPVYQWLPERFAAAGDALAGELDARIVVTGGPGDVATAESIATAMQHKPLIAAGATSLGQMAAVLKMADLLLSVDTSAGHIAAAVGTPVVVLFGPGDPRIWAPKGERVAVVQAQGVDCLGCKRTRCRRKDHACMDRIGVDAVLAAGREMLTPET